ncbi:uncharacterized protein LOC127427770 [Myxocyprinus asiaticus]|uniref:uncharacterized protein LOC127427770 n=1 Tax=Myxocyprinus asiaticus TaxID=70543 RepID=UPI00222384BF|nr:uncharacterized protein LOC127427770 [Myxocyprinus asiaticus]
MEDYVTEALKQGHIRHSTSPAASSFFVAKKGRVSRQDITPRLTGKRRGKSRNAYSATSRHCSSGLGNPLAVNHWFCERVWDAAHHHLQRAVRCQKGNGNARRFSTPTFQPGQKVWLSTKDIRLHLPCKKLNPRYIGPFTILEQSLAQQNNPPPPLLLQDDGPIYAIKEVLDSRHRRGRLEYLVDWEGYGPKECSWVPRDDILDPVLTQTFHLNHPDCPAPRGWGRGRGWPRHWGVRSFGVARGGVGSVTLTPGSRSLSLHTHRSTNHAYLILISPHHQH